MEYQIRDIDEPFWKQIRVKALRDGWPDVKTLIFALLGAWLRGTIKIAIPAKKAS